MKPNHCNITNSFKNLECNSGTKLVDTREYVRETITANNLEFCPNCRVKVEMPCKACNIKEYDKEMQSFLLSYKPSIEEALCYLDNTEKGESVESRFNKAIDHKRIETVKNYVHRVLPVMLAYAYYDTKETD